MNIDVRDDVGAKRYEARINGELVAVAEYVPQDEVIVFTHTEVFEGWEGKGVGSSLVRSALDDVNARQLAVLPLCSFVSAFIGRHIEAYGDLVNKSRT